MNFAIFFPERGIIFLRVKQSWTSVKWLRSHATSMEIAWILRGTCVEYARDIILFLFEHKREGYKLHTDCTVSRDGPTYYLT